MIRSLRRRARELSGGWWRQRVEREWVPLPDGVRLATTLFRPRRSDPRTAALLIRTPFGSRHPLEPHRLLAASTARRGMHAVLQDVRGRFDSEGRFTPFVDEAGDGEAVIRWIEEQPWYDGRLVVAGFSYAGWAALAAASQVPGRVAARVVVGAGSDLHRTLRPGGAFSLAFGLRLGLGLSGRQSRPTELERALRHRPLLEADRVALRETPWVREWMTHPIADEVWPRIEQEGSSAPPTLFVAGLQDPFTPALLADYARAGEGSRLWLGPWPHPRPPRFGRGGRAYHRTVLRAIVEFVDAVLSGEEPPGPAVRLVSPAGGQVALDAWPPKDAGPRAWYLRGAGRLHTECAEEPPDPYTYDPEDPVPSLPILVGEQETDRRPVEARADVLCYTSELLEADVDVMGPARVVLFASSSAPDTDFVATLADVEPDGEVRGVCEGIVRCRHRDGGMASWLEPGEPVELAIDLGACAHRFESGHRLRVEVTSSSLPRYDRNPNTREDPARATSTSSARARQALLHDPSHPSRLVLHVRGAGS